MTALRAWRTASLICGLAACQGPSKPEAPAPDLDPNAHLVPGPENHLQLITKTAVLGFHLDGSVFRASYTAHDVAVVDGTIELTPYHTPLGGTRITGGKLGLETGAIRREDGTTIGGNAVANIASTGAVEIVRGGAVEVITNREDGVEQAWRFAEMPDGLGDLIVDVGVSGQRMVAANATGLHFQSDAGLGFRYSHAVWTDAAGHTWPLESQWKDGRISITVPDDIVAETTFPAVLDPTISAEVAVDNPVNGNTGANARFPAVAYSGSNYLVVWSDQRLSTDEDVFATLVSPAGAILTTNGITVNTGAGRQLHPAVTFAGSQYIVAWEDFKIANGAEADIGAARVSTAGVVTQLGHVAASAQNETQPGLAPRGTNALLVWNNNGDIRASLFNGTAFGGAISVTADATAQTDPTVAADPAGNFLVAYSEGTTTAADLKGQFITSAGALSGAAFVVSAGAGRQFDPSAAWDGTNYVVAWTNNNAGINLFGARVSTAGAVLDTRTEGTTMNVGGVSISSAAGNQELESLACATGNCLVVWQEGRNIATTSFDIYAQRLTTAAALTNNGAEIVVSNANRPQFVPAVATNGTDYFAVWQDDRDGNTDTTFGARITAAGAVTDAAGIMLVTGNNRETAPAMGRAGTIFGVFWTDSRTYGTDIELVRFNGATKSDVNARVVSSATFAQSSPSATASNGNFFVVWNDSRNGVDRDIYGARVDSTGAVLDAAGKAISTATNDQLVPDIATNGTVSLVAWQDRRSGAFDIYGALVDNATGNVTVADIVICNATGDQGRPTVAFDSVNNQFMVVWGDARVAGNTNVFGARVSTAGAVLDANGVLISGATGSQLTPDIAFLNGTALVVWEDRRSDTQGDIFGARVKGGASFTVQDVNGFTISGAATGLQNQPTVSSLNGSWVVAWTDGRNINTTSTDIFGQQVGVSGVLNGAAFAISANPEAENTPSLSDASASVTRIAYQKVRADLQSVRVETRTIGTSSGTGQACSNDGQCSTGFCVDSRCCDTACGGNDQTDCQACNAVKTLQPDGTCAPIPSTTICRNYVNTFCDLREYCDGVHTACPPDIGRNQNLVCNTTTNTRCPLNAAPGPHNCP